VCPVRAEVVDKPAQGRGGAAFARPYQPSGVVINHDEQLSLVFTVGHLIDADPAQPRQPISLPGPIGHHDRFQLW
jgi:hypothetical protein